MFLISSYGGACHPWAWGWSVLILHTLLVCHCRGVNGQQHYLSILKSFGHGKIIFSRGRFDPIPPVVRYGPPTIDHVSFGKATGFPHCSAKDLKTSPILTPQVPPTWPPAVATSHPPQWVGPARAARAARRGCEAAVGAVGRDETCGISASLYQ